MNVFHHLYINPLEKCNLKCKICYTKKTKFILSEKQIMDFIKRYQKECELQTVTFCGGEVFGLQYFPDLINKLNKKGVFVQTITNGTIDRLSEIKNPNLNNFIVSIDGLEKYHDSNRGQGNFQKSVSFLKRARLKGFHAEIFSIVTRQNFSQIDRFEKYIIDTLGQTNITYHPRKPMSYLSAHPISNEIGTVEGFDFLTNEQIKTLMKIKKVFPPPELGCYQISLFSDGKVYGCCEGFKPIGTVNDSIKNLFNTLKKQIDGPCLGCAQPDFLCGLGDLYK